GALASSNWVAANNGTTSTTNFAELGINSSGFVGTGSFSQPNYGYVASASTDFVVGTYSSNVTHFVSGMGATDAAQVTATNVFTA
ncbi:hypothetical protein, partial [Salmonella enterica]|uniref:hypothetical protein n=1 Tax=Salmonella enterica TaxID=28901 RepID=UPI001BAE9574